MDRSYSTRGRWTEGRCTRLDRCAVAIADGRHIEHGSEEPEEQEDGEKKSLERCREMENLKRSFRSNASSQVNAPTTIQAGLLHVLGS
jgi:hypothetical protein